MGFLAPWFLAGVAAIGLPIYLHLLRRHKAEPRPFSSLMFFERRLPSSIRHRRLRYLLLLSLRAALLLLLALAFANPFMERPAAGRSGDKLLLLVIDNSFSMRAGSRLAEARRAALSVLASRRAPDRAQVMTLGSELHALTQPTQDAAVLRAAVQSIRPGDSRASFGELAHALRSLAESVHTPVELHLFSDMQKSAMPANFTEMVLPANVSLVPHRVARDSLPNWTVESVEVQGRIWDPRKAPVRVVIVGYHTPAAARSVSLIVNGKTVATRTVNVPPGGRAVADFPSLDVPYGFSRCEVKLDPADDFPADDASLFAVQRSDPERVLFVHERSDTRSPLYFRSALGSADDAAFSLETASADATASLKPSNYVLAVLSDLASLPREFEDSLLAYIRNGGSVLVAAGTAAARRSSIPVFGGTIVNSRYYSREAERFLTVGDADFSYPSIAKADRWSGVSFYFAVQVDPADARVLARLTDQTPLLLERRIGAGRVLLLASGLDNLTNDFPLRPVFVPFVEQTARYLSGTQRRSAARVVDSLLDLRSGSLNPGQRPGKVQTGAAEIIDPDGRRPLSLDEAASRQTFALARAGFYEVRLADGDQDLLGVNPDPRESDLDVMPEDLLSLWRGSAGGQNGAEAGVQQRRQPYGVWWYVMLFVLGTAIAESLVASRYLGKSREQP